MKCRLCGREFEEKYKQERNCSECRANYPKLYREKNRERINEYNKKYMRIKRKREAIETWNHSITQ